MVQSKSKLVLSTVYWSCDAAQINTSVLFTKQPESYTTLPPSTVKSWDWVVVACVHSTVGSTIRSIMWHHKPVWFVPKLDFDKEDQCSYSVSLCPEVSCCTLWSAVWTVVMNIVLCLASSQGGGSMKEIPSTKATALCSRKSSTIPFDLNALPPLMCP